MKSRSLPRLTWRLRGLMLLLRLCLPLWRWLLARRLRQGKESTASVAQKLMLENSLSLPKSARLIWGHAVGVGEVLALLGLFHRLNALFPDHEFLLTSSSLTSGQAIMRQNLPANFHHQFAPLDHPQLIEKFLQTWNPCAVCWSEMDMWPHLLRATQTKAIPLIMLNARMQEDKARAWRRRAWFYQPLAEGFTKIYAQNLQSLAHMQSLHWPLQMSECTGNIKAFAPALHAKPEELAYWQGITNQRPVWVLASSHDSEERIAFEAHQRLLQKHPKALLIVVPRDAFRGHDIVALAAQLELQASLRSNTAACSPADSVYIADTMGELGLWYALAPIAVIGGSLVPIGGHNPYEASCANCQVLYGPHIHNFTESYEDLVTRGKAVLVRDTKEIAAQVARGWLTQPIKENSSSTSSSPSDAMLNDIVARLKS
jgi:3-deoxy-D-manno-octulosonic-acid transferase